MDAAVDVPVPGESGHTGGVIFRALGDDLKDIHGIVLEIYGVYVLLLCVVLCLGLFGAG